MLSPFASKSLKWLTGLPSNEVIWTNPIKISFFFSNSKNQKALVKRRGPQNVFYCVLLLNCMGLIKKTGKNIQMVTKMDIRVGKPKSGLGRQNCSKGVQRDRVAKMKSEGDGS